MAHLRGAIENDQVFVQGIAERYARSVWKTTTEKMVRAVGLHLEAGCAVYAKCETGSSRIIPHKIQINLSLDEETGEDSDVYVEFTLVAGGRVYIRDAHPHGNALRLPR